MKNKNEEDQIIESILKLAGEYGLTVEVKESAYGYMTEGYSAVDAYVIAYGEWVK